MSIQADPRYLEPYRQSHARHGSAFDVTLWASPESQRLRFQVFTEMCFLGGRRILIAGVTECVPELLALKDVDVAFMPMNIPPRRMTPAATADCVKKLRPKVVYLQHYDNGAVAAITGAPPPAPGWLTTPTVADSLQAFRNAMSGSGVEVRLPDWYSHPAR